MSTATLERTEPIEQATSTVPDWVRLTRIGAATMVVFAIVLQVSAQQLIPPVAVIGVVFLGFIPFLVGERPRVAAAAGGFGALAYVANIPIILDDLANPESAPSFILQLLSTIGVFLVIAGGIGALRKSSTNLIRPLAIAAAGVFIAGSLGSIAIASGTESVAALPDDVKVTAERLMWAPEEIVIDSNDSGIWVDNQDGIRHTFTIPELGIDLEVPALKSRRVDINAAPGSYQIICTVPGHEQMTGTLTISS